MYTGGILSANVRAIIGCAIVRLLFIVFNFSDMKKFFRFGLRDAAVLTLSAAAGVGTGALIALAATTISTNISTAGTLTVSDISSLANASTTSNVSVAGALWVGGYASTTSAGAISTKSTLAVGSTGTALSDMTVGFCSVSGLSVTASSTKFIDCTTSVTISASDIVFVQATSSMPVQLVLQAATTTSATNISLRFLNTGLNPGAAGDVTTQNFSLYFWATH